MGSLALPGRSGDSLRGEAALKWSWKAEEEGDGGRGCPPGTACCPWAQTCQDLPGMPKDPSAMAEPWRQERAGEQDER